jgi:DNA-binding winged helix-turn-helix (wHTH) protein
MPASGHLRGEAGVPQPDLFMTMAGVRERGIEACDPLDEEKAEELSFRAFRLLPRARLLLFEGRPVLLGSRAFDLLEILLRSRGRVVGKQQIVDRVWPTTTVEESNLRFQMASLRRALGDDRDLIKTIPGRGYLFASDPEAGSLSQVGDIEAGIAEMTKAVGKRPAIPGAASVRRRTGEADDHHPQTLEALACALQRCVDALRQMAAMSDPGGGFARRGTRPSLRGRAHFANQRRPRGV